MLLHVSQHPVGSCVSMSTILCEGGGMTCTATSDERKSFRGLGETKGSLSQFPLKSQTPQPFRSSRCRRAANSPTRRTTRRTATRVDAPARTSPVRRKAVPEPTTGVSARTSAARCRPWTATTRTTTARTSTTTRTNRTQ